MNNYLLTILFIGLFVTTTFAQRPEQKEVIITGKVIDKDSNQPLEYATIAFFSKRQNKIITGGITDDKGTFSIKVPSGTYDILIEYISFKTQTIPNKKITSNENIGAFSMELDLEAIDAVEVIAERTTVEIRLDKKIYYVGKDLTVSGGTVSDVLDNVPSVSVDAEGNIALRGNNDVRILINGKPSGLVGLNSTDALQQLPAEAIEKIEVITSPSARYEAEGTAGIINIILRRSKLQGLNGAITANVGNPTAAGISGNINYRTGDINFFNTTSYSYRESPGHNYIFTEFKQSGNFTDETTNWTRIRKGLTTNMGLEWYINDSASITTSVIYRNNNNERNSINRLLQFDENLMLIGESNRLDPEFSDSKTIQYSVNFNKDFEKSGHKLTFDFQFEDNDQNRFSEVVFNGIETDIVTTLEDQTQILLRSDYVLPIGENSQFEIGYRGDFDDKSTDYTVELLNETTNEFEIDTNLSNLFNFKQHINAAYVQFGSKIDKFSYLLGLRMENSQITLDQPTSGDFEKKNYTGLFPSINLNYELSEDENITLGYNRRLRRPYSFFLNPFPSRTSLTNIFQGNPGLDPTYSGKFDLGYLNHLGKVTLSSSLYYQHSTNVIDWVSFETGNFVEINGFDVPVIQRGPVNLATNDRYGFEFNVNYSPTRKWRINSDFNLFKSITKGDFNGENFDSETLRWSIRINNKLTLPGKIDWQTNMRYRGPSEDAQNIRKGSFSASMALSKDLFKDKASIAFNIRDILDSAKFRGDIETETFFSTREIQYRGGRSFNLSFTYRFNQKKKRERSRNGGDYEFEG
ncbi:MAG: TonB-dependent receptor [Bacteroidetes bacterium]|nr:TonB-dependent receptor [Bacteroidota bacterium]